MEKTCWICYTSEAETPKNIRWVSPCNCIGDTKWTHEPCLLTWIIKQQTRLIKDGEIGAVIIHEAESDNTLPNQDSDAVPLDLYINHENETDLPLHTRMRMERRKRLIEEFGEKLIRCPQCHSPYEIQLRKRPFLTAAFMDSYTFMSSCIFTLISNISEFLIEVSDFLVPYVVATGGTYVLALISVSFGIYTTVTVCGIEDPLSLHLAVDPWTLREWMGIFSVPYLLALVKSNALLRSTALASSISLACRLFIYPKIQEAFSIPRNGLSNGVSTLHGLIAYRTNIILGLLSAKYVYKLLHDRVLVPLFVGSRPKQITSANVDSLSGNEQFEEYLTAELVETAQIQPRQNQDADEISLFTIARGISNLLLAPALSSFAGALVKSVILSALSSSLLYSKPWAGRSLKFTTKIDTFTWSLIGGCSVAIVKDVAVLFYNRQRKKQRMNMKILNYSKE